MEWEIFRVKGSKIEGGGGSRGIINIPTRKLNNSFTRDGRSRAESNSFLNDLVDGTKSPRGRAIGGTTATCITIPAWRPLFLPRPALTSGRCQPARTLPQYRDLRYILLRVLSMACCRLRTIHQPRPVPVECAQDGATSGHRVFARKCNTVIPGAEEIRLPANHRRYSYMEVSGECRAWKEQNFIRGRIKTVATQA